MNYIFNKFLKNIYNLIINSKVNFTFYIFINNNNNYIYI